MNIETEFRLTPQIIKRGVHYFWKSCYIRKRELLLAGIFLCLLVIIGFIDGAKSWVNFVVVGLYGLFALWFWIVRFKIYFLLLKAKMNQYGQLADGVMKMQLTDSVVILTGGQMRSEFQWGELRHVVESDEFLLLLWGKLNFTIIPVDQVSSDTLSVIRQKFTERTLTAPVLQEAALYRGQIGKAIIRAAYLWASLVILIPLVLFLFIFFWLQKEGRLIVEAHPGKFWVDILKVESQPNYFMEQVRVHSLGDMKVSIGVGNPREAGQSVQVDANGDTSTCEVLFKVSTSSNTAWHSEIAGSVLDTTFSSPFAISSVETNLSGSYGKDSTITLASLGDKKILLSVK